MGLTDVHKKFVQGMMARRFVTKDDAISLLSFITNKPNSDTDLEDVRKTANDSINKFFLEIKEQTCDITNKTYFVLVSNLLDSAQDEDYHKRVSAYSIIERDYFRNIMVEIIDSDERCIRRNSALNLTIASGSSQSQHLGPHDYNMILSKFIEDGWLTDIDDGRVFLGARAIAELEHMLRNDYKVDPCKLCNKVCVRGYVCDKCSTMVHVHCMRRYNKERGNNKNKRGKNNECPHCHKSEMRLMG